MTANQESAGAVAQVGASIARPNPLLVSIADASEMLSLSRSSIYQLIWAEQLTPIRIGRSVRLSTGELEQFVALRLEECQRQNSRQADRRD